MPRKISPKRFEALKIWLRSGREKKPKEIAIELGISDAQVRKWKCEDRWNDIPDTPNKRGAPYRNRNAVGNKGGGAPKGNQNAVTHGLRRKWLPDDEEFQAIYDAAREGMSTLDILYEEILISFTNFIHAQRVMFVQNKDDMTKEVKKEKSFSSEAGSSEEIEYDIQYAWDKQARLLTAQAAASRSLANKIKQYEEMIRSMPPEQVKEEHRMRIEKMKVDIEISKGKVW